MQIFRSASPNLRKSAALFRTGRWMVTPCAHRSFVACRTRQETQLEEGKDLGWRSQFDSRFASFQQILACRFHATQKNKELEIWGIFGGVLGDFWWFEKKKVGEKVWYFLVFCDIDVVVNWPLTKDLRILWYGLPRCVAGRSGIEVSRACSSACEQWLGGITLQMPLQQAKAVCFAMRNLARITDEDEDPLAKIKPQDGYHMISVRVNLFGLLSRCSWLLSAEVQASVSSL